MDPTGAGSPTGEVSKGGFLTLWHVLAFGLLCRFGGLVVFGRTDFVDARHYREMGRELVASGQTDNFRYMPLYPLWTQLTGEGLTQQLADILLSLVLIWLIYQLVQVLFQDRRAALIAAIIAAMYPHFIFYAVVGLTETAFAVLLCAALLLLYRERYAAGAVLLVLAILVRPTLDPLAPVLIIVFACWVHRHSVNFAIGRLALYVLVYVVLMMPWWVHNYQAYGSFVRLSLGDGIVFYSGNNPMNRSGGGIHGVDVDMAAIDSENPDPVARNAAAHDAARAYIRDNPGRSVEMMGVKLVRFWRLWPYAAAYQGAATIIASLLSYGAVLALAVWFLIAHAKGRWRPLSPVLLFTAYLTLVHIVTIASIRYRFPIEPFLIAFAAVVLAAWSRRWPQLDRAAVRWLGS
ncbi:MAG: hypothetical protein GY791_02380 [Alphaproteobacteria bacterium]|nr:hypothetical protein [Alphaproteobacteria bacterium]